MDLDAFVTLLREARSRSDGELRRRFDRSLPFADGLFDRWERARALGFAEGASIYDSALVYGAVKVGENTWVGPNVMLDGSGAPLLIGAFCSLAAGAHIYTHDTVLWAVSGGALGKRTGAVTIADCVYIGAQALILPGVTIGTRCVIAGNSVVNADVPEGSIVGGTPARIIGTVVGHGADVRLDYSARAD